MKKEKDNERLEGEQALREPPEMHEKAVLTGQKEETHRGALYSAFVFSREGSPPGGGGGPAPQCHSMLFLPPSLALFFQHPQNTTGGGVDNKTIFTFLSLGLYLSICNSALRNCNRFGTFHSACGFTDQMAARPVDQRNSSVASNDPQTPPSQNPAAAPASLSDEDYVKHHNLAELFDMLIYQVSTVKPKHPAAYMAYLMRERLEAQEGMTRTSPEEDLSKETPLPTTKSTTAADKGLMELSHSFSTVDEESNHGGTTASRFEKFGIWIHVQNSDVPLIVARFREQCTDNAVEAPSDFNADMPELLRILSRASAVYYFNGFAEARKLVPLRPHKNSPACCTYLLHAILDVVTIATLSQRRSLTTFMECLVEDLRVDDIDEIRETARFWSSFRHSSTFHSTFLSKMKEQARQLDILMDLENFFDVFMNWVDTFIAKRDMTPAQRQEMMTNTYSRIRSKCAEPRLPDLFTVFAALILHGIRESPEVAETPERTKKAIHKVLLLLQEDENTIAIAARSQRHRSDLTLHVRRSDASTMKLFSRFFSNGFRKKFAEEHGSSRMTLEYFFMMKNSYGEEHSEAFITVSSAALRLERNYLVSENHAMRCNAHSRMRLLSLFVELVSQRHHLTIDEVELQLLRTRCCGVTIGTFLVYLCELFRQTGLSDKLQEQAKFILTILQEVSISANASPVLSEFSASFHLLTEAAERPDPFLEAVTAVPPLDDVPATLLIQFLDFRQILQLLSECFDRQAMNGPEQYFNVCLLIVSRLRAVHVSRTAFCNFFPMAVLSGINYISESVPLYSLLPAAEVLTGLSSSLDLPVECGICSVDKNTLSIYFHQNRSSRALVTGVQNFLEAFPEYRSRVIRPSISYERVQRYFYGAVQDLLRLETEEEKDKLLRIMAIDLACEGMLPRDYDLFSLALTDALRGPGFPEPVWNSFMAECIQKMKSFSPPLRPLSSYQDDLPKISRVQRCARRYIRQRTAGIKPQDRDLLNRLMDELSNEVLDDSITDEIQLSRTESQLLSLTWRVLDGLSKAHAVYSGIQAVTSESGQPRPPSSVLFRGRSRTSSVLSINSSVSSVTNTSSKYQLQHSLRDEARLTFKKCRAVADSFTHFISLVCEENKGRGWMEVWEEHFSKDFQAFFDDLITPPEFMTFGMAFIETVRKNSVIQHPTLRRRPNLEEPRCYYRGAFGGGSHLPIRSLYSLASLPKLRAGAMGGETCMGVAAPPIIMIVLLAIAVHSQHLTTSRLLKYTKNSKYPHPYGYPAVAGQVDLLDPNTTFQILSFCSLLPCFFPGVQRQQEQHPQRSHSPSFPLPL
eukprot:gene8685-6106_t